MSVPILVASGGMVEGYIRRANPPRVNMLAGSFSYSEELARLRESRFEGDVTVVFKAEDFASDAAFLALGRALYSGKMLGATVDHMTNGKTLGAEGVAWTFLGVVIGYEWHCATGSVTVRLQLKEGSSER